MNTKPEALRLADALDAAPYSCGCTMEAAAELRRLHNENEALRDGKAFHEGACDAALMENRALRQANEAFGKRQEWWNERMFELEQQRDELLEQLSEIVEMIDPGGHDVNFDNARAAIARAEGKQ